MCTVYLFFFSSQDMLPFSLELHMGINTKVKSSLYIQLDFEIFCKKTIQCFHVNHTYMGQTFKDIVSPGLVSQSMQSCACPTTTHTDLL